MNNKKIAVIQSNYIPWKGYFDIINMANEFILLDDVQYTRRDWRNRNRIKTPNGLKWLTIPVEVKNKYLQKIKDTKIADKDWNKKHWETLRHNYAKATYFNEFREIFESLFLNNADQYLSQINYKFITAICSILNIETKISWSHDYGDYSDISGKTNRLVELCQKVGASHYLSGPSAKSYIDESLLNEVNIEIEWMNYRGYPEYHQLFGDFIHEVSIIDLIFNEGPNAQKFMKSF